MTSLSLSFVFWKRDLKPLPFLTSGMVLKTKSNELFIEIMIHVLHLCVKIGWCLSFRIRGSAEAIRGSEGGNKGQKREETSG